MIKFKGRLLKFDSENAYGRKISKDCNIEFPKTVPAFYNYDMGSPMGVIGSASISKDDQGLLCDLSILDKYRDTFTEDKYFVGGYYQNVQMRSEAGTPVFLSGTLTAMSIIPDGAQLDDNLFVRKKVIMIKFIKQLFCKHHYELNRWHVCHGPNGNDPAMIEAEYVCKNCGKVKYADDSIDSYWAYSCICKEYERRIK